MVTSFLHRILVVNGRRSWLNGHGQEVREPDCGDDGNAMIVSSALKR